MKKLKKDQRWEEMITIVAEAQVLANSFELEEKIDRDTSFGCDLLLRSILALTENSYVEDKGQRDYLFNTLLPGCRRITKGTGLEKRIDLLVESYHR